MLAKPSVPPHLQKGHYWNQQAAHKVACLTFRPQVTNQR